MISPISAYHPNLDIQPSFALTDSKAVGFKQRLNSTTAIDPAQHCQTCKNRKYQDKSPDPSVSFQSPTHLDPLTAQSAVVNHEKEHVVHETQKAEQDGREVVGVRVDVRHGICPECGRIYVQGGETTVYSRPKEDEEQISPTGSKVNLLI